MYNLNKIVTTMLDILFPPVCAVCRQHPEKLAALICRDCQTLFQLNNTLFCSLCRARLAEQKKICHPQTRWKLGAATNYDNELLQKIIWKLKYRGESALARPLGELLANYIRSLDLKLASFAILPVPLHSQRLKKRGYNQAALIADYIAREFSLPLIDGALLRNRPVKPQTEMPDWDERRRNIAGCFSVSRPELVSKKNILLIDDVCTSGATLNEAAAALKQSGARRIIGLVVAKAG